MVERGRRCGQRCGNPGAGWGSLPDSGERAGDFAFRVDKADFRPHDVDRPRRAAPLEPTRSVRRKPVRTGPGPEERSAEDMAARPAPRSRWVDRAHGARLRARAPSLRDSVSGIGGGFHLAGKPESCPPPRVRGEPTGNLFPDESAGSSRSGPVPTGIGAGRIETRRRRVSPGDSGPRITDM